MTHHDRILSAIRGEPTDRIPWAPRMDLWSIAQRAKGTTPERFVNKNTVEIARELDVACHAVGADFTMAGGRDISLRGLGIDNHQDYPYRVELRNLPIDWNDDGENLTACIQTPEGEVFSHLYRTEQMKRDGISLPFVQHYPLNTPDDVAALGLVFENLEVIPTPEAYGVFKSRIGDQGVAVARGPMAASPMHLILHELAPMDEFFFLYHDARDALKELCDRMAPFFDTVLDVLAKSDADVVFWGANYDQDLTWPPFFHDEITPWLQKVADRLHAAGKYLLTHCDGENLGLLPLYPECRFDVAESVCPAPMTHCTLAEIRDALPDITIWGGIPSIALMPSSMSDTEFKSYLDDLFGSLNGGARLILGVSDNVPSDADLDRLERIKTRIEAFGPTSL